MLGGMRHFLPIMLLAILATSCVEKPIGAVVVDTPRGVWHNGESVSVAYENSDTTSLYNVGIVLRREAGEADESVRLSVAVSSPSGERFESDVVIPAVERHSGGSFAESAGEWVEDARFGEEGRYDFTLTPTKDLKGVWTVGVKVVNNE
ncbi:MAG: hypothetical protein J6U53_00690 [Tidjanibacter sp.]|nr:hypothetical protein [Tidjanibacter sp.]